MKFQEYGSAFIALQTGQVEVLSGFIFITEERQKSVDFMMENSDHSPLNDPARESLCSQVQQLIEEPTTRGFRIRLVI